MRVKLAQAGEGGGSTPTRFTLFTTITYKVAVHAPAERSDTLPFFHLYSYVLCGADSAPLYFPGAPRKDSGGLITISGMEAATD